MERIDIKVRSPFLEPSINVWQSETYNVYAFMDQGMIRLDIERRDGRDGLTWDDLNQIKNDCGFEEFDAVEFFPRKKDIVNTANIRHLYISSTLFPILKRNN